MRRANIISTKHLRGGCQQRNCGCLDFVANKGEKKIRWVDPGRAYVCSGLVPECSDVDDIFYVAGNAEIIRSKSGGLMVNLGK